MPRKSRLLDAVKAKVAAFRRGFTEMVATARTQAKAAEIARLLAAGQPEAAYRLAAQAWDTSAARWQVRVARQLRDAREVGGDVATQAQGQLVGRFDVVNPETVRAAQLRAAVLVTEVTDQTKRAIRAVITRSVRDGIAPRDAAQLIRGTIGLHSRQEAAVAHYRATLVRLMTRPEGSARETVMGRVANRHLDRRLTDLVIRYATRLLTQRAVLIARTEIMTAANDGQRALWRQAAQAGELNLLDGQYPGDGGQGPPLHPDCRCTEGLVEGPGGTVVRQWIVTEDERLCPQCEALDGALAT